MLCRQRAPRRRDRPDREVLAHGAFLEPGHMDGVVDQLGGASLRAASTSGCRDAEQLLPSLR